MSTESELAGVNIRGRQLAAVLCGVIMLISPFDVALPTNGFGPLFIRPLMLATAAMAAVAIARSGRTLDRWFAISLAAFVVAAIVAALASPDPTIGMSVAARFSVLAIVALAASLGFRNAEDTRVLIDAAALACVLAASVGFTVYFAGHDVLGTHHLLGFVTSGEVERLSRPFSNPNVAAMVFAPLTALTVVGAIGAAGPRAWLLGLASIVGGSALALTLSRAGTTALMVTLTIAAVWFWLRQNRRGVLTCALGAVALLLAMIALPASQDRRDAVERLREGEVRDPGRFDIWDQALAAFRAEPWTGVGPGRFGAFSAENAPEDLKASFHAHNLLLELAATGGVVLLAAAACMAAVVVYRVDWRPTTVASMAVIIALLTVIAQSVVDYPLVFSSSGNVMALLVGAAVGLGQNDRST